MAILNCDLSKSSAVTHDSLNEGGDDAVALTSPHHLVTSSSLQQRAKWLPAREWGRGGETQFNQSFVTFEQIMLVC